MNPLYLAVLTAADCELVRQWRNNDAALDGLRTPYRLAVEMQADFYRDVVCRRDSPHRYFAVTNGDELFACVGLTNIAWENRIAEISLIVAPWHQRRGIGRQAVDLVLREAKERLGLKTVFGEVYFCTPAVDFWRKLTAERKAYSTTLPNRKFARGLFWNSFYFSWDLEAAS